MSLLKKIIYFLTISVLIIIWIIGFISHPQYNEFKIYFKLIFGFLLFVLTFFIFTVCIYIKEHKLHNSHEGILDEDYIIPDLELSTLKEDILYLSTILNQKSPTKKDIILLIMQLINKKVINLSYYKSNEKYTYILEKNKYYTQKINNIELHLLHYLFSESDRIDFIKKIKEIYSFNNKEILDILEKCKKTTLPFIKKSSFKRIYTTITAIISLPLLFVTIILLMLNSTFIKYSSPIEIWEKYFLLTLFIAFITFIFSIILKRFNNTYQSTNDTYSWISKNICFLLTTLLLTYFSPLSYGIQQIFLIIFIYVNLTIMIKYNYHIKLSKSDIDTRNNLISLKKYLKNMNYLEDKEFVNIITYEQCIMYGFLFGITIKINQEFDFLQKQLLDIIKMESINFVDTFTTRINNII